MDPGWGKKYKNHMDYCKMDYVNEEDYRKLDSLLLESSLHEQSTMW